MRARHLITIAVAALLVIGGAAAAGAAAPAEQASDNAPNEDGPAVDDPNGRPDTTPSVGPSNGLPEQVPDHVRAVLDTIQSFQDGELDTLGEALQGLLSDAPADASESTA
jgi:hypothetical protein